MYLASTIWEEEKVPEDWVKELMVQLHKKRSPKECDNYRGIALLRVPRKVFCQVIQRRLAERAQRWEQYTHTHTQINAIWSVTSSLLVTIYSLRHVHVTMYVYIYNF